MRVKESYGVSNLSASSWKYFLNKGFYLVLINLIPCCLLSFLISPFNTMYLLIDVGKVDFTSIVDLLRYVFVETGRFWYLGLVGIALLILTVAITYGVIDRHMRIGEFTLARAGSRLNYNLLTSLKFVIVAFLVLAFKNMVAILIYFMWANVIKTETVRLVFYILTFIVAEFLYTFFMSALTMWSPSMLHLGYRSTLAFKSGWELGARYLWKTFFTLIPIALVFETAMVFVGVFTGSIIGKTVLDAAYFVIMVPFYITVSYTLFYKITGTERMDLVARQNKKDIWRKN